MSRRKVLFCYEMRKMIPFLILGLIAAIGASIILSMRFSYILPQMHDGYYGYSYLNDVSQYPSGAVITNTIRVVLVSVVVLCVPGFFIMSMVQFSDLHGKAKREYLSSLPFTQNEKFLMKAGISYGMITLCWLIVSISSLVLRAKYEGMVMRYNALFTPTVFRQLTGSDTTWHTMRVLLMFWLTLIAMYTVYMMCAYLVRSTLLGALSGVGALVFPVYINYVANVICSVLNSWLGDGQYRTVSNLVMVAERYTGLFFGSALGYVRWNAVEGMFSEWFSFGYTVAEDDLFENVVTMSYGHPWLLFFLLTGIWGVCFFLAWRDSKKQDLARINHRIPTRTGRVGMNLAVSFALSGAGLGMSMRSGFVGMLMSSGSGDGTEWGPSILPLIAMWLIGTVVFYGIFHVTKLWKRI